MVLRRKYLGSGSRSNPVDSGRISNLRVVDDDTDVNQQSLSQTYTQPPSFSKTVLVQSQNIHELAGSNINKGTSRVYAIVHQHHQSWQHPLVGDDTDDDIAFKVTSIVKV